MYDAHVRAYGVYLGYRWENHPDFLTITALLKRREEVREAHRRSLEQYKGNNATL